MKKCITRLLLPLLLFSSSAAFAEDDPAWYEIGTHLYNALKRWVTDLIEGVRAWIVGMFQDMLDEILNLMIELLPAEISETTFEIPAGIVAYLGFFGSIFPVKYAATLLAAYSTFKISFWIYRKCLGFFGLVKPNFRGVS